MDLKTTPHHRFRYTDHPAGTRLNEKGEPAKPGEAVHFIAQVHGDGVRAIPILKGGQPTPRAA